MVKKDFNVGTSILVEKYKEEVIKDVVTLFFKNENIYIYIYFDFLDYIRVII